MPLKNPDQAFRNAVDSEPGIEASACRLAHFLLPISGKRDSDWSYAWVPVVAPIVGGIIGAQLFRVLL